MLNLNSNIEIMVLQPSSWCHMKALSKCYVSINKSIKVSIKIFTQSNSENGFRSDVNLGDKCQDFLFLPKNSPSHSLHLESKNEKKMYYYPFYSKKCSLMSHLKNHEI